MPSVHNGLAALFAIAAFRLWRPLGWVVAAYAALLWVGSIHLGWHYAIDGMVSIALTFALWQVTGRIADRLERPILTRPAVPAPAACRPEERRVGDERVRTWRSRWSPHH